MIDTIWAKIGRAGFWLIWPVQYVILRYSKRTRILVVYDKQVLVVKHWLGDGTWSLPGGGLHKREIPVDGAQRELFEETGVNVDDTAIKPLFNGQYNAYGLRYPYQCFVVQVDRPSSLRLQYPEIIDGRWVEYEWLKTQPVSQDLVMAVRAWFKF